MQDRVINLLNETLDKKIYEYGFADITGLIDHELYPFDYGIAILRRLDDEIINGINNGPTVLYFDHYNKVNQELNENVHLIAEKLLLLGINAFPIPATIEDDKIKDDFLHTLEYPFSHKMIATRAGLGWIGKTDLLVSKRFGPRIRLASIGVNTPLLPLSAPIDESHCGKCSLCAEHCPGKAATGLSWNITVKRNEFFDPYKCREYCKKISKEKIQKEISLCGKCVQICPRGVRK